jgi:hypothetical protein
MDEQPLEMEVDLRKRANQPLEIEIDPQRRKGGYDRYHPHLFKRFCREKPLLRSRPNSPQSTSLTAPLGEGSQ